MLRLHDLGARPMHTDEAVNAYLVGEALQGKPFHYDPVDRHGPALAAVAAPLARLRGAHSFAELTESELRLVPVLAGVVTLLLLGFAVEFFGLVPCLVAAGLTALAPLPLYYDRYFIHEPLFAAASLALLLAVLGIRRRPGAWSAVLAGVAAGVMFACKETFVLNVAALALATLCYWRATREPSPRSGGRSLILTEALVLAVSLAVAVAFFTSGGRDWHSLAAVAQVPPHALARALGQGHAKPAWYYLRLLTSGISGVVFCLTAALGGALAFTRRSRPEFRLLALYLLGLVVLYSAIPYKTPWLALSFWVPLALLVGFAVERAHMALRDKRWGRVALPLAVLGLVTLLAADARRRVYLHPADEDNPYAYAHTSEDLLDLPAAVERIAREQRIDGPHGPRIAVIASDPWPLPWYLRHFPQVGYWQPGQNAGEADIYVTSTEETAQQEPERRGLRAEFFGLRPGALVLVWSRGPD